MVNKSLNIMGNHIKRTAKIWFGTRIPGLHSFSRRVAGGSLVSLAELLHADHPRASLEINCEGLTPRDVRKLLRRAVRLEEIDNLRIIGEPTPTALETQEVRKHSREAVQLDNPGILRIVFKKGYRRLSETSKLSSLPRFEEAPSINRILESCAANICYRAVQNPVMGRIGVYIEPTGLAPLEHINILLDQVEGLLSSRDFKPDNFWGQRSPLFRLEAPLVAPRGQLEWRQIDTMQMKGFLYRPIGTQEISFPIMEEYRGLGVNLLEYHFGKGGRKVVREAYTRPHAAFVFDKAVHEAIMSLSLIMQFACVTPLLAFCEFEEKPFVDNMGIRKRTGFTINFVEGIDRLRVPDILKKVLKDVPNVEQRGKIISNIFSAIGMILKFMHYKGFIHGAPHYENFSFPSDTDALLTDDSLLTARVHDFDNTMHVVDLDNPSFFCSVLYDLMVVSRIPSYSHLLCDRSDIDRWHANNPEHLIRNGMSSAHAEQIFRASREIAETIMHLGLGKFSPTYGIFVPYFVDINGGIENLNRDQRRDVMDSITTALNEVNYEPVKTQCLKMLKEAEEAEADPAGKNKIRISCLYSLGYFSLTRFFKENLYPFQRWNSSILPLLVANQLTRWGIISRKDLP